MAIDTRDKRRSIIGISSPWRRVSLPIPSGALGQSQRQQLLYGYSGILWQYEGLYTLDYIAAATIDLRRDPRAMIRITWGASDVDKSTVITSNDLNIVDRKGQIVKNKTESGKKWAYIHNNLKADGSFYAAPELDSEPQMGWFGSNYVSDGNGDFVTSPYIQISHLARSYSSVTVVGDSSYNEYPVNFDIEFTHSGGPTVINVTGNTERIYTTSFAYIKNVTAIKLTISKWSTPNTIVKIIQFSGSLIETYNTDDIVSIDLLEETNSDSGNVPIGNVSSNEIDLSLQNTDRRFSFGNTDSPYLNSLISGRKIEVWFGFVLPAGSTDVTGDVDGYIVETEKGEKVGYMPHGIFWSKDWISSYNSHVTSTSGHDIVYKLSQVEFLKSGNYSGDVTNIINSVMMLALEDVPELQWEVSNDLSGITWGDVSFPNKNYMDILKDISNATLSYTYVNKNGKLIIGNRLDVAASVKNYQVLDLSEYFNYESQPEIDEIVNSVRVSYTLYKLGVSQNIFPNDKTFTIPTGETSLNLYITWDSSPVLISSVSIDLVVDTGTPQMTTSNIYANGAQIVVEGNAGDSFKFDVNGQPYTLSENAEALSEDTESIALYGKREFAISENILITTESQAQELADLLITFYGSLRQDAEVETRGTTLVSVGDTVYVTEFKSDTLETKDYFVIKRQSLRFDGSLNSNLELRRGII